MSTQANHSPPAMQRRVFVAHALTATRLGIRLALADRGIAVCGESSRCDGTVAFALRTRPDVCVVDARLPGGATATVRGITTRLRGTPVVVLGDIEDVSGFLDALRAGATGYLSEAASPDALARTIHLLADGEAGIPRALVGKLVEALREGGPVHSLLVPGRGRIELSHRQSQVIELAGEGHSTAQIAARLAIDPVTVRQHFLAVRRKVGAPTNSATLALALAQRPQ